MKKGFTIVLLFGFLTVYTQAQNFGGGVIIGISTSQVGGDNLAGFNKAGPIIGIFANRKASNLLELQMEMAYIHKGSNNPNMNNTQHSNSPLPDIFLSYIEIPFLLKYKHNERLEIEGGLQTAYLINGYYRDIYGKIEWGGTNPFINYDIGLLLGMSYKYSDRISLNTRISNSIIPIGQEDYQDAADIYNSSMKGKYNSVLSFTLHYNL